MRGFCTFFLSNPTSLPAAAEGWSLALTSGIIDFLAHGFIFIGLHHLLIWNFHNDLPTILMTTYPCPKDRRISLFSFGKWSKWDLKILQWTCSSTSLWEKPITSQVTNLQVKKPTASVAVLQSHEAMKPKRNRKREKSFKYMLSVLMVPNSPDFFISCHIY